MSRALITWIILSILLLGSGLLFLSFKVDKSFHSWQRKHVWKNITVLRRNVTRATDWPAHLVVGLTLAAVAAWRGNNRWKRVFLTMVAAAAVAGVVAYGLKITTGRVRPSVKVEKIWGGPTLRQNFQSFPSGHTAVSTGFFAVLFFVNWRLGLLCLPIPIFVAFSRFFLGAHYLSDTVGGILVGILSALVLAPLMLPEMTSPVRREDAPRPSAD